MNKRNQVKTNRPKAGQPQNGATRWPIYVLMLVFTALLVSGIFLAGRQHFSSMDYGMKNSQLRIQIGELEAQKRRLLLLREVSLSPAEIKRVAKKAGLADSSEPVEVAQVSPLVSDKAIQTSDAPAKSMVVKTAAVSPSLSTERPAAAVYTKPEKTGQNKKTTIAE